MYRTFRKDNLSVICVVFRLQIYIMVLVVASLQLNAQEDALQQQTPGAMLGKGVWEYKMFNNLYTQKAAYDVFGNRTALATRDSWFSNIHQFMMGGQHFDAGAELWIKSSYTAPLPGSATGVFSFGNDGTHHSALSYGGVRFRFSPVRAWERLTIETHVLAPLSAGLEGDDTRPYLTEEKILWYTQFQWDRLMGQKWQVYAQVSPWVYIGLHQPGKNTWLSTPASLFMSYFPTPRLSIYGMGEFWPTPSAKDVLQSWFFQCGPGIKYQLIKDILELEMLYTVFAAGSDSGAGQTYNIGLRLLK